MFYLFESVVYNAFCTLMSR